MAIIPNIKRPVKQFVPALTDVVAEISRLGSPGPQPAPGGASIRTSGGGGGGFDMAAMNQQVIDEFNRLRERYQQTYNARYGNIVNTGNETQAGLKSIAADYKTQGKKATAGIGKSYDQAIQQYSDSLKGVRGDLAAQGASTGALDAQQAQQGTVLSEQATRQKALGDRLNQVTNQTFAAQQGDALTQFGGYKSQLENQLAERLFTLDENQRAALADLAAAVSGGGGGGGGRGGGRGGGGSSDDILTAGDAGAAAELAELIEQNKRGGFGYERQLIDKFGNQNLVNFVLPYLHSSKYGNKDFANLGQAEAAAISRAKGMKNRGFAVKSITKFFNAARKVAGKRQETSSRRSELRNKLSLRGF